MMRRNFDSASGVEYFPTNTLNSVKYEFERVNSVMDSNPNIWIPVSLPPYFLGNQGQVLNPTPLNFVYPDHDHDVPHHYAAPPHHRAAPLHHNVAFPHQRKDLNPTPLRVVYPGQDYVSPYNSAAPSHHYDAPPHHADFLLQQRKDLNPTPISVIYPYDYVAPPHHSAAPPHHVAAPPHHPTTHPHHSAAPPNHPTTNPHHSAPPSHNSDKFSLSSKQNHVPQDRRSLKKILKPTNTFDSEEDKKSGDDEYDGRTHSIPREKNGPYICPKCNEVFDTSQKFAAHMSLHYKSETNNERAQRLRARNKRKYRKFMTTLRRPKQRTELVEVE
ncbi:PREDICTED: uncharacterized protein LOC104728641 [Camelina sativa]|uniref:Uncharacterized protein LOC104728641 n=1 Tax=Camelina sativa TaxID=90675 RepID=A0ABM0UT46_CAMSA|nr:PREDICTED: uncharacterized protein LOC104728641 [Camelina sativa]